jgi:hypothetical protein
VEVGLRNLDIIEALSPNPAQFIPMSTSKATLNGEAAMFVRPMAFGVAALYGIA